MTNLYFDCAAMMPPLPSVQEAVARYTSAIWMNPSSLHQGGRKAQQALFTMRETLAQQLHCQEEKLLVTSNATEGLAWLIRGWASKVPKGVVAASVAQHPAVEQEITRLGWPRAVLPLQPTPHDLEKLSPLPAMVVVTTANSETGICTDIAPLATWCNKNHCPLLVDHVAAAPYLLPPLDVQGWVISGSKIGAGTGCALAYTSHRLPPLFEGGGQQNRQRGGTYHALGLIQLSAAWNVWLKQQAHWWERTQLRRDQFEHSLDPQQCRIQGSNHKRLPSISAITLLQKSGEEVWMLLDHAGILCSMGTACASGLLQGSPTILALTQSPKAAKNTLRLSFSPWHLPEDIDNLCTQWDTAIKSALTL